MSTLSHKLVAACMVTAISMVMYGCGGGGSSSSDDMMTGNGEMCAAGQTGTYPDCMDPPAPTPMYDGPKTATAINAYGESTEATKSASEVDSISRAVDGTLTFEDDDQANTENLLSVSEDAAPDARVDGWMGSRVTKTVMEEAAGAGIVYTNIMAPMENKLETTAFDLDGNNDDDDVIVIDTGGATGYPEAAEVMGTFNDTPGTFTCTTGNCSLTHSTDMMDADYTVASLSGSWEFTSTDNEDSASTPTTDYMYFGAWLVTPEEGAYTFKAFAGGDTEYTGGVGSVEGTATYAGMAAGLYATKENEIKSDGTVGPIEGSVMAGEFTAMARLTANFGGGGLATDNHFMMTGAISDFMDGDQELGFLINLMTAAGDGNQVRNEFGEPMANASHGTNPSTSATWSYDFFGANADNAQPTGIAGVFDAHFANGHVAGGFGATRE